MTVVRGAGGGGKGGGSPTYSPDTLRAKTVARIVDVLGEGEIVGLVDGARSIFFDDTPLQNADGSYNFKGVTWAAVVGLPDQHALPGFPSVENEVAVGVRVRADTPVVRTISNSSIDALRIKVRVPSLFRVTDKGDVIGSSVSIAVDVRPNGGSWTQVISDTISGKCSSPYERQYRIQRPLGSPPWDLRVRRLTADSTDDRLQNETLFASYTEVIDWKLSYPDTALIGITIDAEQFGATVPRRTYDVRGLKIRVPVNYDPQSRTYSGMWNGQFKTEWTDNPAWVLYDLLTNPRYGLGRDIDESLVDKWALYEIARYCDEPVPDGAGGFEPRYTFNGVINSAQDAWQVLQSIASVFAGMIYWGAGVVTVTQDRPSDPVKLVTNANVINGAFSYQGTALSARHSVALVTWNNPEDGYRPTIEVVEDPEAIARFGWRQIEFAAVGTTSRGQARRIGRWLLDTERYATETVTYRASLDHADLRPGDVIAVADRWLAGARTGGRVVSSTSTTVTVDAPVVVDESGPHTLRVSLPDGSIAERTITNPPGTHTTLGVTPAFITVPAPNAVWMIAANSVQPRLFRVVSVSEVEDHIYEVTALAHDPGKYARVEQGLHVTSPSYTAIPSGPLAKPSDVTITEYLAVSGHNARPSITIAWQHSPDPRVRTYQVQIKHPWSTTFAPVGETQTNSLDIVGIYTGPTSVRVRAADVFGRVSEWEEASAVLLGENAPPSNITNLRGTVLNERIRLTWDPVPEEGYATYTVRHSPLTSNATWLSSVTLASGLTAPNAELPLMTGTYFVRAVAPNGALSPQAAAFVNTASPIQPLNAVATLTQQPSWSGTKTNTVVSSNTLTLAAAATTGTYQFASPDLTQVYTSRVSATLQAEGILASSDIFSWPDVFAVPDIFSASSDQWEALLELRTTDDDPSASPTWSAWQPFVVGDYTARAFQFRLTISSLDNRATLPVVHALTVSIDMPDRVESADGVSVPATGLDIQFSAEFADVPSIVVTGRDLASGDRLEVTNQTVSGFRVRFFDMLGNGVARVADWVAVGYGRRL